jgi:phosphonate transport system ATP-binding protein
VFTLTDCNLGYGQAGGVLRALNLHIGAGERVALLGKSGSGKSTLLAHLRALQPDQVAWCPQHPALVPQLSVFHNIYSGGLQRQWALTNLRNLIYPGQRWRREVGAIASQLGLADCQWRKAGALSGGQQQRVGIGRAVYQQRPILLAEEPVSARDRTQGAALLRWLLSQHATAVLVLHQAELALSHCDRIIGLADGRIALDAPSASLNADQLACLYR